MLYIPKPNKVGPAASKNRITHPGSASPNQNRSSGLTAAPGDSLPRPLADHAGVTLAKNRDPAVEIHLDPAFHDEERLVLDPVVVQRAGLPGEQEHELAAVPLLDVVGDGELRLAEAREVAQAEVQGIGGRGGTSAPG